MRLSLLVRTTAVCCALGLGTAGVFAQSGYTPSGGESAIAGVLPGDQVRPQLSLSPSGGYLVWQDNNTCRYGLGISALALDNTLRRVGANFRVNKIGLGDQENPQVSLLSGGGAAFVWQGGRQGFQHIYGRFLSTNNAWLAEDMLISSPTNRFQRTPAVAGLAGGSVAVVWTSFNQAGSGTMQDVYGQLLSPAGERVGGEFLVNQFTDFNQRSPAIAALSNGGFVVVWVSELQRGSYRDNPDAEFLYPNTSTNAVPPSVDVYGRLFDANGSPQGNEFLVNTSSNSCAHPSVAAAADGSFVVTWAERDMQARMNQTGWDVYARAFSSAGTGGVVGRVNSFLANDQRAPQVSALRTNYLVVWTSLGQDGSWEGVYGQFLQADASHLGDEFRVNTTTLGRQVQPTVASDGAGQFLSVWASFTLASQSVDLFGQGYAATGFVPAPATVQIGPPPPESFIDIQPGSGNGPLPPPAVAFAAPGLDFPGLSAALPGAYTTNANGDLITSSASPLAGLPGAYNGLFYDTNGVSVLSAGSFSAKVTTRYAYSAKLALGGRTYTLSGKFDANGQSTGAIVRSGGLSRLMVSLQLVHLPASSGDQIRGTVTDTGNWQAQIVADRLVFDARVRKATAYAGSYTLVIPPATNGPAGSGFGTLKVSTAGLLQWTASLADGSKLTQSSAVSAQGYCPLLASLYRGQGMLTSWLQLVGIGSGGKVLWIKPQGALALWFPGSFTNSVEAALSPYAKSTAAGLFQGGSLSFSGGAVNQMLTKALVMNARGQLLSPPSSQLKLSLNPASGLFQGTTSLLDPLGGKVSFQGVVVPNQLYGAGFFQKNGVSGQVYWSLP